MPLNSAFVICADESASGKRLDVVVSSLIPSCSRSIAASLILKGIISVQGNIKKPGYRVKYGDKISGSIPAPEPVRHLPEPLELDILHEDEDIIVINKPPGMVVHPAPGHYSGTLVNALLYHCPDLPGIGGEIRPGIVHRLDKDTSGALVVAKNDASLASLAYQFRERKIRKQYLALVHGSMEQDSGSIALPIGRHPSDRKKMSVLTRKPRMAETAWEVAERFDTATLIRIDLKTGRTHQIRVHCAAIRHPVVGDPVYGGRAKILVNSKIKGSATGGLKLAKRQMLHAWRIRFNHPATKKTMEFEAPVPDDMAELIGKLRN
ncbi:MAG: RluA family pseudouridine synthase [Desulfobacteraceae bacterium]|nr:MAG: RluA family pseudouridine synthase [Desulfobacteraceae bacterium]